MKINIKIKLFKLLGTISLCLILNSSCNKFLDVKPVGEIPSEQMLQNEQGFESALYGVYASMASNNLYGRSLSHQFIDLLAQYFNVLGDANEFVVHSKNYNYTNSDIEEVIQTVWLNMYKNIANVNNILINLEKKDPSSMRLYNIYKGEALGLRAFMHFDLLRLYTENIVNNPESNGIPYSVKFELSPSAFSNAAKVYELIIADLLMAEELLSIDTELFTYPKTNPTEPFIRDRETHFNLYAVQATLARVYLTKGDKVNAAKYAKKVIESTKFELMDKGQIANNLPRGVLNPKETIFGLYSQSHFATVRDRFYIKTTYSSYVMRSDLEQIYEKEQEGVDYRLSSYYQRDGNAATGSALSFIKLVDPYQLADQLYLRPTEQIDGINLIRLPEMHYIVAEALLESSPAEAMDSFNKVLESRGLNALNDRVSILPLTVERITDERYKEFVGEGQTFFNMKRLNLPIKNTADVIIEPSNQIYVWPIPYDEIEFNN